MLEKRTMFLIHWGEMINCLVIDREGEFRAMNRLIERRVPKATSIMNMMRIGPSSWWRPICDLFIAHLIASPLLRPSLIFCRGMATMKHGLRLIMITMIDCDCAKTHTLWSTRESPTILSISHLGVWSGLSLWNVFRQSRTPRFVSVRDFLEWIKLECFLQACARHCVF